MTSRQELTINDGLLYAPHKIDNSSYGLCQLASGEQFVLEDYHDPDKDLPLVERLVKVAKETTPQGFYESERWETKLYESAERAIRVVRSTQGEFGFNNNDAKYWAKKIVEGDDYPEKIFPHWVFLSIVADLSFSDPLEGQRDSYRRFRVGQPKTVSIRPDETELKDAGFSQSDVDNFLSETPPTLVGKAVPIFGWFDEYGFRVNPEFTLLRKDGGLLEEKLVFPGGHASSPLELTSWRKFQEGVDFIDFGDCWWPITGKDVMAARHPLSIDQVSFTEDSKLEHRWIDVFSFEVRLGGLCGERLELPVEEYEKDFKSYYLDDPGKNDWEMQILNSDPASPIDQEAWQIMMPAEKIALKAVMNRDWQHFSHRKRRRTLGEKLRAKK